MSRLSLTREPSRRFAAWEPWATIGLMTCLWGLLINVLRVDWEINPQYSYGWLVPLFAIYLFWKRWPSRPELEPVRGKIWLGALTLGMALLLGPILLVRESSPDWTIVHWGMALDVIGLSLISLAWIGGWSTVQHFAWPTCFMLVAVPWPGALETMVTQGLMQRLAEVTAELVGWAGYVAEANGNLIRLRNGVLGVDEACSGVRSLQSMLMASLFLGELYRLGSIRRLVLLLIGLALALFFNLVRSLTLVSVALSSGVAAVEKWHDSAGLSILVLSFGALALVIRGLGFTKLGEPAPSGVVGKLSLPIGWTLAGAVWLALITISSAGWYWSHERGLASVAQWTVRWPSDAFGFRQEPIADNVRTMLAYNEGHSAHWVTEDGGRWQLFFFQWKPGRTSSQAARIHRPEICLPATGRTMVNERELIPVRVGGIEVPFRAYLFSDNGRPLHVYFCLWETANQDLDPGKLTQEWSSRGRLERAWAGHRNLGQQSVEVILTGIESVKQADEAFLQQMEALLSPVGAD